MGADAMTAKRLTETGATKTIRLGAMGAFVFLSLALAFPTSVAAQQVPAPINAPASVTGGHGLCATANPQQAADCGVVPGTVTNVTASAPLSSTGGATPAIAIANPLPPANGGTGVSNGNSDTLTTSAPLTFTGSGPATFALPSGSVTYTLPGSSVTLTYQVGSWTSGHCLQASGTGGGIADSGAACGGGGGSGTVNSGTAGQVAYYASTGSAVSGESLSTLIDSAVGSTRGSILERGASGWALITPGTAGTKLVSNGSGADPSYQTPAYFLAYMNASSTVLTNSTYTLIAFDTDQFDPNSWYSTSTGKFTPQLSGKWRVSVFLKAAMTGTTAAGTAVYKNGAIYSQQIDAPASGVGGSDAWSSSHSIIVSMNGSTDYVQAYGFFGDTSGSPSLIGGTAAITSWFMAEYLGP